MDILLISVGKISSTWINEGVESFNSRINKYIKYQTKGLPDIKNAKSLSKDKIKEEEGKLILNELIPSDFVVILDERGKEYTSRGFAEWIEKQMVSGRKRLIFVIGGPYGFSREVYARADIKIALSEMTFTHEMAKLFITEQIYRSMTILRGEPYHHD